MASAPTELAATPAAPELIARRLIEHVELVGPTLGARLGLLARTLFPGFNPGLYGCRNLRAFIEKHAPDLRVVGKSGPDPLYGRASGEGSVQPVPLAESAPDLWRVWVSPGAALAIWVNPETGNVAAGSRNERPPVGHIAISPAPLDVHQSLARAFLESIDDGTLRAELAGRLAADGQWWRFWVQALRPNAALLAKWQEHRQRMLGEALKRALNEAGLAEDVAATAYAAILGSRRKRPPFVSRYSESTSTFPSGAAAPDQELLIVEYVTARMSARELRGLSLPLGLTLEAIEHLKASR
jgi:hypothetical protein